MIEIIIPVDIHWTTTTQCYVTLLNKEKIIKWFEEMNIKFEMFLLSDEDIQQAIKNSMFELIMDYPKKIGEMRFIFKNKSDAMLFKLTWC